MTGANTSRCRSVAELSRFVVYLIGEEKILHGAPFTDIPLPVWGMLYSDLCIGSSLMERSGMALQHLVRYSCCDSTHIHSSCKTI